MSFLDKLNEISRPKLKEGKFDFGDGEESIWFKPLTLAERQRIFNDRMVVVGKDESGKDLLGIDAVKQNADINADLLSACWVRPDGKPVASKDAFKTQWDAELLDKIATICMEVLGLAKKKDETPDPSTAQS